MDQDVSNFIKRFSLKSKLTTTDENGDRTTILNVNSHKIILIIGDSVAFGGALNDSETLASQLQQRYLRYKFINASVPNSGAKDNIERLRQRLAKYGKRVEGVIYVHCENDFSTLETPEYIISGLSNVLKGHDINFKFFLYQVYIYRAMPDLLRGGPELIRYLRLKNQTISLAKKAGFKVMDSYEIVNSYRDEMGTPLAGFSLYVDHCHFSALGTKLVADQIRLANNPGSGGEK